MKAETKIFGAPLDPSNSPERLDLKLAYLGFLEKRIRPIKNFDPYDAMKEYLGKEMSSFEGRLWWGKLQIESWLTPRPKIEDRQFLNAKTFSTFLFENGCWDYALRVRDHVEKEIYPSKPVMIGVDHSLSGGVIMALSNHYEDLNVIVLDAHLDALRYQPPNHTTEFWIGNGRGDMPFEIKFYGCGNFIFHLVDGRIVNPRNLWILGVQDQVLESLRAKYSDHDVEGAQKEEYWKLMAKGVHLVGKTDLTSRNFSLEVNGPTYLSIDMDVGSLSSIYSARFMNCIGLNYDEFRRTLHDLSQVFQGSRFPIVGLDIMEMDIHFLEASRFSRYKDYSREISREIFKLFL